MIIIGVYKITNPTNIHKVLDIDNRSCKGFIWKTKI
jgi:hypothetical protein